MPHFSSNLTLPPVPANVTLEQFILGGVGRPPKQAEVRFHRPESAPWLVCDKTGREMHLSEIGACSEKLQPFRNKYKLYCSPELHWELTQQLIALLPHAHIGQAYGQTEATGMVSMWSIHTKHCLRPGSSLVSSSPTVHTLADYNERGEFFVKTPAAALGYFGDEAATKETFVDGWIRTGDQVSIKTDTEIVYIDRFEEIMKVRGFQVAPAELEESYNGEVPLAFVVPTAAGWAIIRSNTKAESQMKTAIMEYVGNLKSPYKHVRKIEFVDEIPKNPTSKLLRRILRERARELVIGLVSAKL